MNRKWHSLKPEIRSQKSKVRRQSLSSVLCPPFSVFCSLFKGHFCLLIFIGCWLLTAFFLPTIVHGRDWPMWRYDAGRCAASPEELPAEM
ncbi:MAG: hypothetical protein IIB56_16990, partial [Planctomycetes bacterium]|nr:hypothetical protein [Planctomycetota bacterium]